MGANPGSVSAVLTFVFVGVPVLYFVVRFCFAFLKDIATMKHYRGGRDVYTSDEIDGMYVEKNGQVRVDG